MLERALPWLSFNPSGKIGQRSDPVCWGRRIVGAGRKRNRYSELNHVVPEQIVVMAGRIDPRLHDLLDASMAFREVLGNCAERVACRLGPLPEGRTVWTFMREVAGVGQQTCIVPRDGVQRGRDPNLPQTAVFPQLIQSPRKFQA